MGNQETPLRRSTILIYAMLSPMNKTQLCMERGQALQELLGQRLCQEAEMTNLPGGGGWGGQTPQGLQGRAARPSMLRLSIPGALGETKPPTSGFRPLRKFQLDVR